MVIDWSKLYEVLRISCTISEGLKIWQAANILEVSEEAFRAALAKDGWPEGWHFDQDAETLWPTFNWSSRSFDLETDRDVLVRRLIDEARRKSSAAGLVSPVGPEGDRHESEGHRGVQAGIDVAREDGSLPARQREREAMTRPDPVPTCPTCKGTGWVHEGERPHTPPRRMGTKDEWPAYRAACRAWSESRKRCPACWGIPPRRRSSVCDYCGQPLTGDECQTEYGRSVLTVCLNCRGGQR
jgi:hypothetical protein